MMGQGCITPHFALTSSFTIQNEELDRIQLIDELVLVLRIVQSNQ